MGDRSAYDPAKPAWRARTVGECTPGAERGSFYVLWTGCQWKALPKDRPPKSTVHDYLERWQSPLSLERCRCHNLTDRAASMYELRSCNASRHFLLECSRPLHPAACTGA